MNQNPSVVDFVLQHDWLEYLTRAFLTNHKAQQTEESPLRWTGEGTSYGGKRSLGKETVSMERVYSASRIAFIDPVKKDHKSWQEFQLKYVGWLITCLLTTASFVLTLLVELLSLKGFS